jgi:hypothetical protein
MSRTILVFADKEFRITVEDDDKLTFGPWTPPKEGARFENDGGKRGTLRVYRGNKENIIGVFSGVTSFREESLDYEEKIAVEEGSSVWKSDQHGYERKEAVNRKSRWEKDGGDMGPKRLAAPKKSSRKR